MSVKEKIEALTKQGTSISETAAPSVELREVLAVSGVEAALEELDSIAHASVSSKLMEKGSKMVFVVKWPSEEKAGHDQLIISATEESLSFTGNQDPRNPVYLRLEREEIGNKDLVEEYLARAFLNPTHFDEHLEQT